MTGSFTVLDAPSDKDMNIDTGFLGSCTEIGKTNRADRI